MNHDLFISYSRKDFNEVRDLIALLQGQIPELQCWFDITDIEAASEFEDKIISAITESSYVLFALSDNSMNSNWTKDEVTYAKNIGKKVIPVLLKGATLKDGWFLFKFGRIDCIDSTNDLQMQKLVKDLSKWTEKHIANNQKENQVKTKRIKKHKDPDKSKDRSSVIDSFFPVYGITLERTTLSDVIQIKNRSPKDIQIEYDNDITIRIDLSTEFLIETGKDVITEMIVPAGEIPPKWKKDFGFNGRFSFLKWKSLFESLHFDVEVTVFPHQASYRNWILGKKKTFFNAELTATAPDKTLKFVLEFVGEDGTKENEYSQNTLCMIIAYSSDKFI